jgi:hypothetical protein
MRFEERIDFNEDKFVVLYLDDRTQLVYEINIHTPNNREKLMTYKRPMGITREEARQLF